MRSAVQRIGSIVRTFQEHCDYTVTVTLDNTLNGQVHQKSYDDWDEVEAIYGEIACDE